MKKKALLRILKENISPIDKNFIMYGFKITDINKDELMATINWFSHELRRVKRMTELRSDAEIRLSLSTFV